VYPGQTTYNQAPTYTIPGPIYTAPTYTSSAPTYTAPAPNFAPPAPSYTQAPPQTYTQAPVPTYTQAQPVSQNCNCLTKSYMQDGSVVFTDVCTKETAMAAPAGWQHGQSAQQTNY
jgi:hypothetical protein